MIRKFSVQFLIRFMFLIYHASFHKSAACCERELSEFHPDVLGIIRNKNYSRYLIPPVADGKSSLKVFINLGLRDIKNIDDKKMELKLQLSFRQRWTDIRLKFDSQGKEGYVTLPLDMEYMPWTPDTFINNEEESNVHSLSRPNAYFRIYPNGTIRQNVRVSLTMSCLMNLRHFPFDKQACELRMASYSYPLSSLEFFWEPHDEPLTNIDNKHLTQFRLIKYTTGKGLKASATTGDYSTIFVTLAFQRQTGYYILQFFVPSTLFVALSWVSFWLGPAVEARLATTVTILLTLTTQISGFQQALPQVSYITAFSAFSGICIAFGVFSICQSAIVFPLSLKGWQPEYRRVDIRNVIHAKVKNSPNTPVDETQTKEIISALELTSQIDRISKVLFPSVFFLILVVYFGFYLWRYYWFGGCNDELDNEKLGHDDSFTICS